MRIESAIVNPEQVMYARLRDLPRLFRQTGVKIGSRRSPVAVAAGYHSQQCDQRWWGIRIGPWRLAYRTRGDASRDTMTYRDGGWWWPWHTDRTCSGLWL